MAYAKANGIPTKVHYPDHENPGPKSAPLARNLHICRDVDVMIAFWDGQIMQRILLSIAPARQLRPFAPLSGPCGRPWGLAMFAEYVPEGGGDFADGG